MKQRKPGCYIATVLLAGLMLGGCGNPNAKANTAESVSASDSETVSESEEIVSAEGLQRQTAAVSRRGCLYDKGGWQLPGCRTSRRVLH